MTVETFEPDKLPPDLAQTPPSIGEQKVGRASKASIHSGFRPLEMSVARWVERTCDGPEKIDQINPCHRLQVPQLSAPL